MRTQLVVGDVVRFRTEWPWAQREARILEVTGPIGNYRAFALGPFDDVWRPTGEAGVAMWIPPAKILEVIPSGEAIAEMTRAEFDATVAELHAARYPNGCRPAPDWCEACRDRLEVRR